MEQLPDSIILEIMSHLDCDTLCLGARLVCTRWWRLTSDRTLWKHVTVPSRFDDRTLNLLLRHIHDNIVELDIGRCEALSKNGLSVLTEFSFDRLKKLFLPFSRKDGKPLEGMYRQLAGSCPHLEELNVKHRYRSLDDDHFKPFYPYLFSNLRVFNDSSRDRGTISFKNITQACKYLDTYRGCNIDTERLMFIADMIPHLRSLDLDIDCSQIDSMPRFFSKLDGSLRELFLVNEAYVSEDDLRSISHDTIRAIADNCPKLEKLHIRNYDIDYITEKCPNITSLTLIRFCDYHHWDDQALEEIPSGIGDNLAKLTSMSLDHCDASHESRPIAHLVAGCPWLQILELLDSPLDDEALHELTHLQHLRRVTLRCANYGGASPDGLMQFMLSLPTLQVLHFSTEHKLFKGDRMKIPDKPGKEHMIKS